MVGIERVMDHVAHALGKDPMEVRRLNYYAEAQGGDDAPEGRILGKMKGDRLETADLAGRGSVKVETGSGSARRFGGAHSPVPMEDHGNTTPYGMEVEDFILGAMTERLERSADIAARKARVAEWNAANDILKRGIAVTPVKFGISFTLTHLNQAGALVHVYQDGSIHMNHGGTEMGQGLFQKVAQVAADRFGVGMERVKITATDTARCRTPRPRRRVPAAI
jgi:xanthine dehydrogenase large subunit